MREEKIGEACFFISFINDNNKNFEKTLEYLKLSCTYNDPQGCFGFFWVGGRP